MYLFYSSGRLCQRNRGSDPMIRTDIFLLAIAAMILPFTATVHADAPPVTVNWLDKTPPTVDQGVSWGVRWPKGAVAKNSTFTIKGADGASLPVQSWPLAYWPDGSIKWAGLATVVGPQSVGPFQVSTGAAVATNSKIVVTQ